MTEVTEDGALALLANEEGYDPIEDRLRAMVRQTIEAMFEEELAQALGRARYARDGKGKGYRNCSIPDDHISPRRSALFMARSVMRDIRDGGQAC